MSRRVADVRRALVRCIVAAGRGCIAGSRRGGGGEGRTFLLRRNVLCAINFLEKKFYFFFFFLKSVRAQGGREEERERGERNGNKGTCAEWRRAAVWRAGPMSVKSGDAGRHGEMRFVYDRWMVRESVYTGRHAVPQTHSNAPAEIGFGKP